MQVALLLIICSTKGKVENVHCVTIGKYDKALRILE